MAAWDARFCLERLDGDVSVPIGGPLLGEKSGNWGGKGIKRANAKGNLARRFEMAAMNEHALAGVRGPVTIACAAPFGIGGMGRHLEELVSFCRGRGWETRWFATNLNGGPEGGEMVRVRWAEWLKRIPPVRFSAAWQGYLEAVAFDRAVAGRLSDGHTFIGFNGQCLASLCAARRLNFKKVIDVAATPHVNLTVAQARAAFAYAPVESAGFIGAQQQRFLREYGLADQIVFATEYVRESFLAEGVSAEKLTRFELSAHPRFHPNACERKRDGKFRIVAVGSLNLVKGTAVLLDAFSKFNLAESELTLVGGSGSRKMRRFLADRTAQDPRIKIAPGDPLPFLHAADVCVHAAFQDGFAYAPMEAIACGVPVIVTEHTGMKEYILEGVNGLIVPAGNAEAIVEELGKIRNLRSDTKR
jgi:glycosyltransferase involved in cell wall biosynthesis